MQKTFVPGNKNLFVCIFGICFAIISVFSSFRAKKISEIKKWQKIQEKNLSMIEKSNLEEVNGQIMENNYD